MPTSKSNPTYHLNYSTGHPAVCRKRDCDVPARDHFKSEDEATRAYEIYMWERMFADVRKQSPRIPLFDPASLD